MIETAEFKAEDAGQWKKFLERSNNGTLFHDLDFLAYHGPNKFQTRHLLFFQDRRLIGLLPAAIVTESDGRKFLKSPYGASVGGFVLPLQQSAETVCELVDRLKHYVVETDLQGIDMRLAPNIYMREPNDHLGFALMAGGFHLTKRMLCHVMTLPPDPQEIMDRCKREKSRDARMGLRRGLYPMEASSDRIGDFYRLLRANMERHKRSPTHTQEEICNLFSRVPRHIRLFLCNKDDQPVAGILVFSLNTLVSYTFYIVRDEAHNQLCPTTTLLVYVSQQMVAEGYTFLDLGPTTFEDLSFNSGLVTFKEGFGARGYCRDTWRWERA